MNIVKKIKTDLHWFRLIHNADSFMSCYPDVKALDNRVNIPIHDVKRRGWEYYHNGKEPHNLGDELASPIVNYMLNKKGIMVDKVVNGRKHLFTVGSGGLVSFQNATMWGTGIMFDFNQSKKRNWWDKYYDAIIENLICEQ